MDPLTLLFPSWCVLCGYMGTLLCGSCTKRFAKIQSVCHYCGRMAALGLTHPACKRKNGIDGEICLYKYEQHIASVICGAKYQGAWSLLDALCAHVMNNDAYRIHVWKKLFNPTVIPVPLHPHKMRQRGFNQSEIIASHLVGYIKPKNPPLVRWGESGPQATLKEADERRRNVRGIFRARAPAPKTVLLVDDVITTGSTVEECARTLKRAGTKTVLALSVAKG